MVEEPITVLTNCSPNRNVIPFDLVIVMGSNVPEKFKNRFKVSLEESGMSQDTYKSWKEASKVYGHMSLTCKWYERLYAGFKTLVISPWGSWSLSNVTEPRQVT